MKAMLLAAGRGERMGVLTESMPKPLLEVAGKPLLQHHIERLVAAGFREIVINTAYLGHQIANFVGDGSRFGALVHISAEEERLETGGGIFHALGLLGQAPFVVVNSDIWTDFPLASLPQEPSGLAHLVLVPNPPHNPAGDFGLEHGLCREDESIPRWTFSGISVLTPLLFGEARSGRFPLAPLLRAAMARGQVSGEAYRGTWIDVGTPERLRAAERIMQENNK